MARVGVLSVGIVLLAAGAAGYIAPVTATGFTIPQVYDLCQSDMAQFAQSLEMFVGSQEITKICMDFKNYAFAVYGSGVVGIILVIVGAVTSGAKQDESQLEDDDEPIQILKERYAKGEITKEEFEQMKKDLKNS